jgi:hypothetical protein
MRTVIVSLFAGIATVSAIAQKSPVKFGEIPLEDLKMSVYAPDSSAAAVIFVGAPAPPPRGNM